MSIDDKDDKLEGFDSEGGDDFSDDFGDDFSDDFGDDFSDDLSEENVGFGEEAASEFEDETVVYDEEAESAGDSPFAKASSGLEEYKKYILMAFSVTIIIIMGVLMMSKKKQPSENFGTSKTPVISDRGFPSMPSDTASSTTAKMDLSSLRDMKEKLEQSGRANGGNEASMGMQPMMQASGVSKEQFTKILEETKLLGEQLGDFKTHFDSNRDSLSTINSTISTLEKSLREANTTLIRLDEKMAKLKEDLAKQHTMITKLEKKPKKKAAHDSDLEMVSLPVYHLYAAIPGRAWLKSDSGTTITIAVGSKVPGYGKVSLIEPIKGVVVTDSGYIFRFAEK